MNRIAVLLQCPYQRGCSRGAQQPKYYSPNLTRSTWSNRRDPGAGTLWALCHAHSYELYLARIMSRCNEPGETGDTDLASFLATKIPASAWNPGILLALLDSTYCFAYGYMCTACVYRVLDMRTGPVGLALWTSHTGFMIVTYHCVLWVRVY